MPHICPAYSEIAAGAAAKKLQYLCRRVPLRGGTGKFQQKFLKRIVFSGSGVARPKLLFGTRQKAPSTTLSTIDTPQVID
jgi:hypothetical protein